MGAVTDPDLIKRLDALRLGTGVPTSPAPTQQPPQATTNVPAKAVAAPARTAAVPPKSGTVNDPDLIKRLNDLREQRSLEITEAATIARVEGAEKVKQSITPLGEFTSEVTNRISERMSTISDIEDTRQGEQPTVLNTIKRNVQQGGQVAGGVFDVVGQTLILSAKGLSFIAPDFVKGPAKEAWDAGVNFMSTNPKAVEAGEAISKGLESYGVWAKDNPDDALTLEGAVNIALLAVPLKVGKGDVIPKGNPDFVATPLAAVEQAGKTLITASEKQVGSRAAQKAKELILPTAKVPEQTVEKSILGFKYNVIEPTQAQQSIINTVAELKIPQGASAQRSLNIVDAANVKEAATLERLVASSPEAVTLTESHAILDAIAAETKATDIFVTANQLERMVDDVVLKAKSLLKDKPQTPLGVLQTRKELDAYIKQYKPNNSIFPNQDSVETALSIAVRNVRVGLNELVGQKVPTAQVLERLSRQSNLYRARPILIDKAKDAASNSIGRLWQTITGVTGMHLPATPAALGFTLAAVTGFLPALIGTVGIGVAGRAVYKGTISPALKKFLGQTLVASSAALKKATNPATIRQLHADRAIIIELMKQSEMEKEPTVPYRRGADVPE